MILCALLEQPGQLVSRDDLCRRLWPHGTFVDFEHSLNAAVRRLRVALGDHAGGPRFIETVPKRGYRFIAIDELLSFKPRAVSPHLGAGARAAMAHLARGRARLAVLPFGPHDGFSEGLTEEAITRLAQSCPQHVGVIAQHSVQRAHRDAEAAGDIGRALGADYLLEGYVRRDGDRLRITAQLIDAQEETHLWANTFDRVMTDVLTVQSEVAGEIAKAVIAVLSSSHSGASTLRLRVPGL